MKLIHADIADEKLNPDLLVVTTNGCLTHEGKLVMGAGVALKFRNSYPGIDAILGAHVQNKGNTPCLIKQWTPHICSLPTKNRWQDPSPISLVTESLQRLVTLVDYHGYQRVVLPCPGVGYGMLSWVQVKPICAELLDDRFTVVTL